MIESNKSRRTLLKGFGAVLVNSVFGATNTFADKKPVAEKPNVLDELEFIRLVNKINQETFRRWGFTFEPIDFIPKNFNVYGGETYRVVPENDLNVLLRMIENIYKNFEKNFSNAEESFKKSGLIKKIVVGKKIENASRKTGFDTQGYADYVSRTLFFSKEFIPASENEIVLNKVLIHEVSHLLTFVKIRESNGNTIPLEDYWMELIYPNSKKTEDRVGNEPIYIGPQKAANIAMKRPEGFARYYGKANFLEDFATVSEIMFEPSGSFIKNGWIDTGIASDTILMRKCRFVARIYVEILGLSSDFFKNRFKEAGYTGDLPWE